MSTLEEDLAEVLNRHNQENASDTPDYLLARFLVRCLDAWNATQQERTAWYSRGREETPEPWPGPSAPPLPPRGEG